MRVSKLMATLAGIASSEGLGLFTPHQPKRPKPRQRVFVLTEGNSWSPLKKWPRNATCWCDTGKKAKHCCLPNTPLYMPTKEAKKIAPMVKDLRKVYAK